MLEQPISSQLTSVPLRRTAQGWEFASEKALEDFVWSHIEMLLQLQPLHRQYVAMGEICDIVALTPEGQLAIVELKNTEDRYVVQQLMQDMESSE